MQVRPSHFVLSQAPLAEHAGENQEGRDVHQGAHPKERSVQIRTLVGDDEVKIGIGHSFCCLLMAVTAVGEQPLKIQGVVHPVVQVVQMKLPREQHNQNHSCSKGKETINRLEQTLQDGTPTALSGVLQSIKEQRTQSEREKEEAIDQHIGPKALVTMAVIGQEAGDQCHHTKTH